MTERKPYQSPFLRVAVSKDGGEKIKHIQEEFDKFWSKINRVADKSPEKFHAMKAMQEASMWLTRACALSNQGQPTTNGWRTAPPARTESRVLKPAYAKEPERFTNRPTIVVKRKKV